MLGKGRALWHQGLWPMVSGYLDCSVPSSVAAAPGQMLWGWGNSPFSCLSAIGHSPVLYTKSQFLPHYQQIPCSSAIMVTGEGHMYPPAMETSSLLLRTFLAMDGPLRDLCLYLKGLFLYVHSGWLFLPNLLGDISALGFIWNVVIADWLLLE